MFEGKPPVAALLQDQNGTAAEGEPLREISWSDLRARLEAARDLRHSLALDVQEDPASFDVPFARQLSQLANGKEVINPTVLGNGKGARAISHPSSDAAVGRAVRN
jgi:hypothetical protein